MTIAQLLEQSRSAHKVYRANTGRMKEGRLVNAPKLEAGAAAIQDALKARVKANTQDPDHSDAAWAEDLLTMQATDAELTAFYAKYLAGMEFKREKAIGKVGHGKKPKKEQVHG